MKRNCGIDLFRLIGAFFIILLHTSFGNLDVEHVDNIRLLSRWAVPFYFLISGYFLEIKLSLIEKMSFDVIQKNILTLFSILIVASALYLPLTIFEGKYDFSISNLLTGSYFHLWFVGSLIFGYLFIWYLFMIHKDYLLPYISAIIIVLALLANSYDLFINKQFDFSLFRFLLSIPLMTVGGYIARKKVNWTRYKYILFGLVFLGLLVQYAEVKMFEFLFNLSKAKHQLLIGTLITAISLFLLSLAIEISDNRFAQWGREHSLFIYLYHVIVFKTTSFMLGMFFPNTEGFIRIFSSLITFLLTLLLAVFLKHVFNSFYQKLNGNWVSVKANKKIEAS